MNYNKKDIINYIKKKTKINIKNISLIINFFLKIIILYTKKNKIIKIKNFGKFFTKKTKIKKWTNPINKKIYTIYSKKILKFKTSTIFKKKINQLHSLKK